MREGFLENDEFVQFFRPDESLSVRWRVGSDALVLGGNGTSSLLAADLRRPLSPVVHLDAVGIEFEEALLQAPTLASFLDRVEAGIFRFDFSTPYAKWLLMS